MIESARKRTRIDRSEVLFRTRVDSRPVVDTAQPAFVAGSRGRLR